MTHHAWHGDIVTLRAIEPGDWTLFRDLWADAEDARRQALVELPRGEEAARLWTTEQAALQPTQDSDEWHWVIEDATATTVGQLMTTNCNRRDGVFDYGVGLLREHRGKGYGYDAARLVLRFYFEERRYQKAQCTVAAFNEPSLRLQVRLGFMEEGRRRRAYFTGGGLYDDVLFGLTAEEFAARHGATVMP